ncbi:MAG: sulfite exporter TauE/SafE family protein [Candidatus Limnocylindrales bacterium]
MLVTLLLVAGGVGTGVFGALLGLGGGILIVPLLTLGFGLPFREAVAISLLAVITTSSVSAAFYLARGAANLRLGMTLELLTAFGALVGGLLAFAIDERWLAALFAVLLVYVAVSMARRRDAVPALIAEQPVTSAGDAPRPGGYVATLGGPGYTVRRLPAGLVLSGFAGLQSALLGVGGGIIKVPAMHLVMGVPLRVATATSNLTIGVTASASAVLYLLRGAVDPYVAGPVVLGVFLGATVASRLAHRVPLRLLRWLFVIVLAFVAVQMILRALQAPVAA